VAYVRDQHGKGDEFRNNFKYNVETIPKTPPAR